MSHKVLVSIDVTSEQLELISSSGDVEITVKNQKNLTAEDVHDKEIIVGNIAPALTKEAKALKFLQLNSEIGRAHV